MSNAKQAGAGTGAGKPKTLFDQLMDLRDQQRATRKLAVVRGRELPWEDTPMGRIRWYLHPLLEDRAVLTTTAYEMEIPPGGRSGRIKFQGGMAVYVIAGRGRTVIDGEVYEWKKDSVIQLPLRPEGIIYQHFNADPEEPARLMHTEPNTVHSLGVDRGCGFEVLEPARSD